MGFWMVGGLFGLILIAIWAITIADIVRRHLGSGKTAAWLVIVLLLPFIGSLLYWILRKPSGDEVEYQAESERAVRDSHRSDPFDRTGFG
jgi:hypothetical protein